MKILLLSDNHGFVDEGLLKHVDWADEVWHAGDWLNLELHQKITEKGVVIRGVFGNVDGVDVRQFYPEYLSFEVDGLRVFMTHIGGKPYKYPEKWITMAMAYKPHLYICGHSHLLRVERDQKKNWLFINPGAVGLHGFHKVRTAIRFEILQGAVKNMEVIEWKRK